MPCPIVFLGVNGLSPAQVFISMSKLTLLPVRAIAHFRIVFANFCFIFANVYVGSMMCNVILGYFVVGRTRMVRVGRRRVVLVLGVELGCD